MKDYKICDYIGIKQLPIMDKASHYILLLCKSSSVIIQYTSCYSCMMRCGIGVHSAVGDLLASRPGICSERFNSSLCSSYI